MNFCSDCGESVIKKIPEGDNRERHVCPGCETIHYQNPKVIAGVLPVYGEKILLCKRAIEPRHGYWTLPAGFLENGESSMDGALRECIEEANARVINPELYALFDIPQINQVYVFYRANLAAPDFGPSLESSEVALFDEADIPWAELAFPVVELALDHYLRDRKSGQFAVKHEQISRPWKSRRN
ncbi:MAG: NUDIX hydrolase [Porticoccaceae bacterium]|jgi:ADP-ribose pyrophosphatase YjhB (NUDIX family)|nr:NUDIX hydrolase [Porticoccaceae bacterium]MBT5577035.1 NUDIX hydrolase [Porticoccaceae bacterium]MBT7376253.1 NUDIX hydrolase [Porticoccaceae bacterium]